MNEKWMPVLGYEGQYEVSSLGRVRSWVAKQPGLIMRQYKRKDGYWQVQLKVNQKPRNVLVHVIQYAAFFGNGDAGEEINHMDGNKGNNNLENLERVTHRENILHAVRSGFWGDRSGEANSNCTISRSTVREIRAEAKNLMHKPGRLPRGKLSELANKYGMAIGYASSIIHGRARVNE